MKRFSAAGWRVITCSRHPFPENCPWEAGPEDHIQVDLADPECTDHVSLIIQELEHRKSTTALFAIGNGRRRNRHPFFRHIIRW